MDDDEADEDVVAPLEDKARFAAASSSKGKSRRRSSILPAAISKDSLSVSESNAPKEVADRPSLNYDISLCVSLLSLYDFDGDGLISQEDWRRGTRSMNLAVMGDDDDLWEVRR